jgi:signal transduction histidine kinase/Tfp pilus assembly protein PilF
MKHFLFVLAIFVLSGVYAQNSPQDSVNMALQKASDEEKITILQKLIISLWLNHPDSAMVYARKAIQIAKGLKNPRYLAIGNRMMGGVQSYRGDYDSSLIYNKKALALSIAAKDTTLINNAMNNVGLVYYHLGDYTEALENLFRSLNLKKKIKQDYGMGLTLNNIGLVYTKLKDYDKARQYFQEALIVCERLKDKNIELYSKNNIGFTYLHEGNTDQALEFFQQAVEIAQSIDNINWHATTYSGLGQVYLKLNQISQARQLFKTSLGLRQKIGDKNGMSEIYFFLSRIQEKTGKLDSALFNLRKSQRIVAQTKAKERKLENLDLLKQIYVRKKMFDSALVYQTRFIELRDSLFNENLARNLSEIQMKIQDEQTQQQLAEKDTQIHERTLQTRFLLAFAAVTIIFLMLYYIYFDIQKNLSHDLARKNTEINSQKEEIESQKEALQLSNSEIEKAYEVIRNQNQELANLNGQLQSTVDIRTKELDIANRELRVVNLELDNFIYKSSHDIKGPLVRLLGICHVAMLDIKDEKSLNYLNMLNTTAKHLNDIFDRLKIVSNINTLEVDRVRIDFDRILQNVRKNVKALEGYDQVEIVFEDSVRTYYSDPFLIETIFHNMVENAVRFQRKSDLDYKFIRIRTRKQERDLIISFVDNGIGIRQNDADHIFKMFSQAALEHNTVGLGLYIVKQCVNKLNGSVSIVKSDQRLTEFEVVLPAQ